VTTIELSVLLVPELAGVPGQIGLLELELMADGAGELYQDPRCAVSVDESFLGACRTARGIAAEAWEAAEEEAGGRLDVRWRLDAPGGHLPPRLQDRSMGAAFAVGLLCLLGGRSSDPHRHIGITAAVREDGVLEPVGDLVSKLVGAREGSLSAIADVIVAADQPRPEDTRGLRVHEAGDVWAAAELLRGLTPVRTILRRYARESYAELNVLDRSIEAAAIYQELGWARRVGLRREPPPDEAGDRSRVEASAGDRGRTSRRGGSGGSLPGHPLSAGASEGGWGGVPQWRRTVLDEWRELEPVKLAEAFGPDSPGALLLSPPGGGKTTLCGQLARACALGARPWDDGRVWVPVVINLGRWEREWQRSEGPMDLASYVAERHAVAEHLQAEGIGRDRAAQDLRQCLRDGQAVLLLDGVDEVACTAPEFWSYVHGQLRLARDCPVLVTSRPVGDHWRFRDLPRYELAELDEKAQERFLRAWLGAGGRPPAEALARATTLAEQLREHPGLRSLAGNPLLLGMVARAFDDVGGGDLPARRSELYRLALRSLLEGRRRAVRQGLPVAYLERLADDPDGKLAALARASWQLFAAGIRTDFAEHELRDELNGAVACGDDAGVVANGLLEELERDSGLIQSSRADRCYYLHPTLQEYLAALGLVEEVGADGPEALARIEPCLHAPAWREVVRMVAGVLPPEQAIAYITAIAEAGADHDELLHRSTLLACSCCAEVSAEALLESAEIRGLLARLVELVFDESPFVSREACDVLATLSPCAEALVEGLLDELEEGVAEHRAVAARALGRLGSRDAAVIDTLLEVVMEGGDSKVRAAAVGALGDIRLSGARVLDALEAALADRHSWVRANAARALGVLAVRSRSAERVLERACMGEGVGWPEAAAVLADLGRLGPRARAALAERIGDGEGRRFGRVLADAGSEDAAAVATIAGVAKESWRYWGRQAVVTLATVVPRAAAVVAELARILEGDDPAIQLAAARALGNAREAIAPALQALGGAVQDRDVNAEVRCACLLSMGRIGRRGEDTAAVLRDALRDTDDRVRWAAAQALGETESDPDRALEALAPALSDRRPRVRAAAVEALGRIGRASPRVRAVLLQAVADEGEDAAKVRWSAVRALAKLEHGEDDDRGRPDAELREVLTMRLDAQREPSAPVRVSAAEALGELFPRDRQAYEALCAALQDDDMRVKSRAAAALVSVAPSPRRLSEALLPLVESAPVPLRIEAIGALSRAGVSSREVMAALGRALEVDDGMVRLRAMTAMAEMAAGQPFDAAERAIAMLSDADETVRLRAPRLVAGIVEDRPELAEEVARALASLLPGLPTDRYHRHVPLERLEALQRVLEVQADRLCAELEAKAARGGVSLGDRGGEGP